MNFLVVFAEVQRGSEDLELVSQNDARKRSMVSNSSVLLATSILVTYVLLIF